MKIRKRKKKPRIERKAERDDLDGRWRLVGGTAAVLDSIIV